LETDQAEVNASAKHRKSSMFVTIPSRSRRCRIASVSSAATRLGVQKRHACAGADRFISANISAVSNSFATTYGGMEPAASPIESMLLLSGGMET
jgi:hypothetical protein